MNLIKSTGTFSFFTIISRILGYIRDILIAIFLGAGPLADAFFVAFRIPNTFRRIFGEGSFNAPFQTYPLRVSGHRWPPCFWPASPLAWSWCCLETIFNSPPMPGRFVPGRMSSLSWQG